MSNQVDDVLEKKIKMNKIYVCICLERCSFNLKTLLS